jgi:crotonobetainyl-CoA:carnitine CoA-transferase CaiB-like acyl-CoA transferase
MQVPERDSTRDWVLPEDARPPLVSELVARIDEALATARASEAAVMTVGAAAIDAAEQAKRAAELAERASAAMLERSAPAPPSPPRHDRLPEAGVSAPPPPALSEDDSLRDFSARADRLAARLKELQHSEIPPVWGGPPGNRVSAPDQR